MRLEMQSSRKRYRLWGRFNKHHMLVQSGHILLVMICAFSASHKHFQILSISALHVHLQLMVQLKQKCEECTILSNLILCLNYYFNTAICQTDQAPPVEYPANLGGGGGKVGTLNISWDAMPVSAWNADPIRSGYVIYWKRSDMEDDQWDHVSTLTT